MEEAELLKERLQAITGKRKLQEEITQKRHTVEEEKLKHQHLKKKALREKWLLDGLNTFTPKEREEMQNQNQEDQQQMNELEQNILRLEKEIEDLEKKELSISVKEKTILKKLKSVERTTEDIIKSVKVEQVETRQEPADDIYANIPDLPKSFRPSALKRTRHLETENDEENRKALFAMEIKVEKDMKTGESTVLSTIPLPSEEFTGAGVKVYDDGRKSIYAVCTNGTIKNSEADGLAPVEVEDLLRQATEKQSKSPTEYHEPVYANEFFRPATPLKDKLTHGLSGDKGIIQTQVNRHDVFQPTHNKGIPQQIAGNGLDLSQSCQPDSHSPVLPETERTQQLTSHNEITSKVQREVRQEFVDPCQKMRENQQDLIARNSVDAHDNPPVMLKSDEDSSYSVVHAVPCYVDDTEPVTMIFMGYQHVDDEELNKAVCGYDGLIHAELVVIDDDGEEEDTKEDTKAETPLYHPVGPYSQVYQPPNPTGAGTEANSIKTASNNINNSPYKNSISLKEQEESLTCSTYNGQLNSQLAGDGTEDPSLTALRMRMAKLGKKVI